MQHISGISRQQLQISSLEDKISLDNPVCFMEAFVEHISLELLGFTTRIAGGIIAIDGTKSRLQNSKKANFSDLLNYPNTKPI